MDNFKQIYSQYKDQVYFFVKKHTSSEEDAEDIVQEIFVHLWKYKEQLKNAENPEAIIFKTSKQEIGNFYRKNNLTLVSSDADMVVLNKSEDEVVEEQFSDVQINKVLSVLDKLPPRSKDFLIKNKLENLSYAKIASQNNISKSAVEKQINKALHFLKANLGLF